MTMRLPRVFYLVQKAHSSLFRAADQALKRHVDLTASQQAVLFVLSAQDGAPLTVIADRLKIGKSSLTGLITRMEEKGLVRRAPNRDDARSFLVFIEPPGRAAVDATRSVTQRINAGLLDPFSKDERAIIERFLTHVADNAAEIVADHAKASFKEKVET